VFDDIVAGKDGPVSMDILQGPSFPTACFYSIKNPTILISPDLSGQDNPVIIGAIASDIAFLSLKRHGKSHSRQDRSYPAELIRFPGEKPKRLFDYDDDARKELLESWGFKAEHKAFKAYQESQRYIAFDISEEDIAKAKRGYNPEQP
jgi:hypothetical protein